MVNWSKKHFFYSLLLTIGLDIIKKNFKSLRTSGSPRLIRCPHPRTLIPWAYTSLSLRLLTVFLLLSLVLIPCSVLAAESAPVGVTHELSMPPNVGHTPVLDKVARIESSVLTANNAEEAGGIQVVFELTEAKRDYVDALQKEGVTIQSVHEDLVQGLATTQQILSLSQLEFIQYIRRPLHPSPLEVVSEGREVIQANLATQNLLTGKGVKVAVIDAGFDVTNAEIAANVKESRSFKAYGYIGTEDLTHGTAVAEIIVDIAPEVELYLYSIDTDVEFLSAVDYATERGVKIMSISLGWYNLGPYDGTSRISKALDSARQQGVLPVVAAGNEARRHWEGAFTDSDGDDWHEFATNSEFNAISLNAGTTVSIFLSWDDWPLSAQDYDLYLYDSRLNPVAWSRNLQSGSQRPTEDILYTARTRGTYYISIRKTSATKAVSFELFADGGSDFQYFVDDSSIANLADASGALTVGATYWADDTLESFSGRGPTADGRTKPDIAAPDGVSTSSLGFRGFFGTSASAPHVSGSAALILAANPRLSADEVASILEKGSVDLGPTGKDNLYGSGRVRVSFVSFNVNPKVSSLTIDGTTYSPTQLPVVLIWTPGTTHRLSVLSTTVEETDTRHIFTGWTDNNTPLSSSQTVTLTYEGGPRIVVAWFEGQFLLTVISPYGNPKGGGWYDSGALASFSVTSPDDHGNLTRRVFLAWSGDSTSKSSSTSLTMDSPKKAIATWSTQYYLTVESLYDLAMGEGWYNKGFVASISVETPVDHGNLTRRVCTGWTGDLISTQPSATINVDSPKRVVADWKKQYYLTLTPNGGQVSGEGWYDYNSLANATATTPTNVVAEKSRLVFTSWTGDITSDSPTVTLRMTQPRVLEANWRNQFFLRIDPQDGPVDTQSQWADKGSSITITAASSSNEVANKSRLVFAGWQGAVVSESPRITVTMDETKTINATWKQQFYLLIISEYGNPRGGEWYDAGSIATASVTSPVGFIVQQTFISWTGDVNSPSPTVTITMDSPKHMVANWANDYTQLLILIGGAATGGVVLSALRMRKKKH